MEEAAHPTSQDKEARHPTHRDKEVPHHPVVMKLLHEGVRVAVQVSPLAHILQEGHLHTVADLHHTAADRHTPAAHSHQAALQAVQAAQAVHPEEGVNK